MASLADTLRATIDQKTKPPGSLGKLEQLALRIGLVQGSVQPQIVRPAVVVFAADHGAAAAGVSSYPREVTAQMVLNFLAGGAAINVFCAQHEVALSVVDAGVDAELPAHPGLVDAKIARGTRNYLECPAMTEPQYRQCLQRGADVVEEIARAGTNTIGFGEMGIGNSASASLLMSAVCQRDLALCVGRGAGADDAQLQRKLDMLKRAQALHGVALSPDQLMQTYGGFELAQMTGAMLAAQRLNLLILVDGFIATSALLIAAALQPAIHHNVVYCHRSAEAGHQALLDYLGAEPLLDLDMRLGEGTGCALALPLLRSAVGFVNQMASFDSAGIASGGAGDSDQ